MSILTRPIRGFAEPVGAPTNPFDGSASARQPAAAALALHVARADGGRSESENDHLMAHVAIRFGLAIDEAAASLAAKLAR